MKRPVSIYHLVWFIRSLLYMGPWRAVILPHWHSKWTGPLENHIDGGDDFLLHPSDRAWARWHLWEHPQLHALHHSQCREFSCRRWWRHRHHPHHHASHRWKRHRRVHSGGCSPVGIHQSPSCSSPKSASN